jgi:hypothetical protein
MAWCGQRHKHNFHFRARRGVRLPGDSFADSCGFAKPDDRCKLDRGYNKA